MPGRRATVCALFAAATLLTTQVDFEFAAEREDLVALRDQVELDRAAGAQHPALDAGTAVVDEQHRIIDPSEVGAIGLMARSGTIPIGYLGDPEKRCAAEDRLARALSEAAAEGRRCFYTSPIKALASEKFFALCALLAYARYVARPSWGPYLAAHPPRDPAALRSLGFLAKGRKSTHPFIRLMWLADRPTDAARILATWTWPRSLRNSGDALMPFWGRRMRRSFVGRFRYSRAYAPDATPPR